MTTTTRQSLRPWKSRKLTCFWKSTVTSLLRMGTDTPEGMRIWTGENELRNFCANKKRVLQDLPQLPRVSYWRRAKTVSMVLFSTPQQHNTKLPASSCSWGDLPHCQNLASAFPSHPHPHLHCQAVEKRRHHPCQQVQYAAGKITHTPWTALLGLAVVLSCPQLTPCSLIFVSHHQVSVRRNEFPVFFNSLFCSPQ